MFFHEKYVACRFLFYPQRTIRIMYLIFLLDFTIQLYIVIIVY